MATIEDAKRHIAAGTVKAREVSGPLQQAIDVLEEAKGLLANAITGTNQQDLEKAVGQLQQTQENIGEQLKAVEAACTTAENCAEKL